MELKLKKNIEEAYIYEPFSNTDIIGKFIEKSLYPHLYKLYPELFDVIVEETKTKKTKIVDDILINNGTEEGGITE
jgi:hypothetical protein